MKLAFAPLSSMSLRDKTLLICCGTLIVLIGFYFLVGKPRVISLDLLQSQVQQQRLLLENARQDLTEMPDPDMYYRQLQAEEVRVKTLLPDNDAITDLLVTLNALGKSQNVRIGSIKQGVFVDHKTYYEIPLEVTVTGTYPDLIKFINKMENLPRFNSITKIAVRGEEYLLTMQLAVGVYVYGPMPQNAQVKSK